MVEYTYLLEIYSFGNEQDIQYWHLENSRVFSTVKKLEDTTYYKNNKLFVLTKMNLNET